MWQSFKIAFSMYSAIPMPNTDWNEKNMRYAVCFFPFIGIPIGGCLLLWFWLCEQLAIGILLTAVVASIIPAIISGCIHLDGFCDTVDALSSHQTTERKLEILKDSHTGAFAILGVAIYFLLLVGAWSEYRFSLDTLLVLCLGFIVSRALSGLALVTLKPAKNSGLLRTFSDGARKKVVAVSTAVTIVVCLVLMAFCSLKAMAVVAICDGLMFLYYKQMSKYQFGGITGDLAGYFVTLCELAMVLGVALFC